MPTTLARTGREIIAAHLKQRVQAVPLAVPKDAVTPLSLTYQQQVVADGASNYWPLDDPSGTTARDLAMANPGTISGGVTLNQPGVTADSKAMTFNGTTGKIVTGANVSIPLLCTIELWAHHGGFDQGALLNWGNEAPVVSVQAGGKVILYDTNNANVYAETASLLSEHTWYALTVVLNGTTALLYRNGVLDSTLGFVRTIPNAAIVSIGYDTAYGVDQAGFWLGPLQDVAIYPRALSAAEIAAHYELQTLGTHPEDIVLTDDHRDLFVPYVAHVEGEAMPFRVRVDPPTAFYPGYYYEHVTENGAGLWVYAPTR